MPLELVVNNWNSFRRPKIIKRLPRIWHNKEDHSVIAIRYSVRNQFANDSTVWFLIRKEP